MCTSWDHSPYRDLCTDHHTGVRSENLSLQCNSWILTCKDNVRTVQLEGSILNSLSKIQTWDLLACFRSFQPQLVCFLHGWSFFAVMLCGWITEGSARQRPRTTRLSGAPGARASIWSDCYTFHRASQTYDYMAHKMTTRGYKQLQPYTKWLQKDTNNYNQTQNDYKKTQTTTTRHKMTTKRHTQLQPDTKWLQRDTHNYNQTQNDYKETQTTTKRHNRHKYYRKTQRLFKEIWGGGLRGL